MTEKFYKISIKDEFVLMFLSFFYEPIEVSSLDELLNSYWRTAYTFLKIDYDDIKIVFLNTDAVVKKDSGYIIEDLIIREQYFIKMFNSERKIFEAFCNDISSLHPYSSSYYTTRARINMYWSKNNKYDLKLYTSNYTHEYFDFMLNLFYQKKLNFAKYKDIILKIWVHRVWKKLLNFENIDIDIRNFQRNNDYWQVFLSNEDYSFILPYYFIMKGDLHKLLNTVETLYGEYSIKLDFYEGLTMLLKGNYSSSIEVFKSSLQKLRKKNRFVEDPLFYGELHTLVAVFSVIKYPELYTPLYNSYYRQFVDYKGDRNLIDLLHRFIKGENIKQEKIENYNLGITTVVNIMSYSWLTVKEQWNTRNIEEIAEKAFKSGYYWIALEMFYILKSSIDNKRKWSESYNRVSKRMKGFTPVSSIKEFNSGKDLIFNLIAKDLVNFDEKKEKNERIIWILKNDHYGNTLTIHYQSILKSGKWSKPKNISFESIFTKHRKLLSLEDNLIARYYGETDLYNSSLEDISDKLVGMKNIFNSYDFNNIIVFENGKYPINIYDTDDDYRIELGESLLGLKLTSIIKQNDYLYKIIKFNDTTLNLLKEIKETKPVFSFNDKNQLLDWIKNNKTLDINTSFYHPEDIIPKEIEADLKIIFNIELDNKQEKNNFQIKIKISPAPNWKEYSPLKKGKTIIHKDTDDNYFKLKRNEKKENELISKINEKLDTLTLFNDLYEIQTSNYTDIINILDKSSDIDDLEIRWVKNGKRKYIKQFSSSDISWQLRDVNNWFEIDGTIDLNENEKIYLNDFLSQKSNKGFITLKNGDIITITEELRLNLEKLEQSTVNKEDKILLPPYLANDLTSILEAGKLTEYSNKWNESIKKYKEIKKDEIIIPDKINSVLRSYQREGVKWISKMTNIGFGVCLADDMGLGKTIQVIVSISMAPKKTVVVVPASVLYNWKLEINKFAPELDPIIYEGPERISLLDNLKDNSIVITSYSIFQIDSEIFNEHNWGWAILDEAQMIKNSGTKRAKAIFEIKAEKRVALSGTPIENHLGELWSLFYFLDPMLLGSKKMFKDLFIKPIFEDDYNTKELLKKVLAPFLLRRLKKNVLKELPDKTEIIHLIDFKGKEKSYYEGLRREALKDIESNIDNSGVKRIKVLAHLMKLRQASCDISLAGEKIPYSSKTIESLNLIKTIIEGNNKVLVFSQFTSYLAIIKKALDKEGISYLYLDGATPKKTRQSLVDEFQDIAPQPSPSNPLKGRLSEGEVYLSSPNVFLISLKAGGIGLNLTAANYVIHLDPWWNPAVEDQATDRTHRIGQSKTVTVYKMIVKDSIEEKIIKLHNTKKDLSNSILDNMDKKSSLSISDLINLL